MRPEEVFALYDQIPRVDSPENEEDGYDFLVNKDWGQEGKTFGRLRCRRCKQTSFEVLHTDDYETSARCNTCGAYYLVHSG